MEADLPQVSPELFWKATVAADAFSVAVAVGVVLLFFYPCCYTPDDTDDNDAAVVEAADVEATPVGSGARPATASAPAAVERDCPQDVPHSWWEAPRVVVHRTPPPPRAAPR